MVNRQPINPEDHRPTASRSRGEGAARFIRDVVISVLAIVFTVWACFTWGPSP